MNETSTPAVSTVHEMSALPVPGRTALELLLTRPNCCIDEVELPKSGYRPYLNIVGDQFVVTRSDTEFHHAPSPDPSVSDERTEDLCQFPVAALVDALTRITPGKRVIVHVRATYINRITINGGWNYASPLLDSSPAPKQEEDDTTLFFALSGNMQKATLCVKRGVPEKPYVTVARKTQTASTGE
ncbi:MAG TPA: hypothetical protein VMR77_01115 [Patescibacteria group bacterium]|jgi:hypothetical protein|nr:hypothetical protein [Patescibacteria group bacterium]